VGKIVIVVSVIGSTSFVLINAVMNIIGIKRTRKRKNKLKPKKLNLHSDNIYIEAKYE